MGRQCHQVRLQCSPVAAGNWAGQGRPDPEGLGVTKRLLDKRAVDGERARLVEAGDPAQLGDRVEEGHEATCGEDRGGVVGGLRAPGEADGLGPDRLRHLGQHRRQLVVALDGHGGALERRDRPFGVGEGDEGVERPHLGARGLRRRQRFRSQRPARVDDRLAAVQPETPRHGRDGVVGDGQDHELDFVEQGVGLGEGTGAFDQLPEPLAALRETFERSELNIYDLDGPTGRHGVLLGTKRWQR